MDKLDNIVYKIFAYLCSFLMFVMMTLTFAQVVCRYVLRDSLTWSEELGRYIFVWMTFIGMAVALYKGGHVALDILLNYLHGTPRKILAAFDNLLIIIFAIAVTYSGASLFNVGLLQRSSAMNIPMHWVYAAVPVSGVVLLYFALRKMYKDFKADDNNNTNAQQG